MHRHGYKGRKFGRETDQRRALIKGLAAQLIYYEAITTTLPKAKELRPYVEKLITTAKVGDLHSRRQVISKVAHVSAAHKLVDEIAPKLKNRTSGYLRIERTELRRGDNTQMARISFVDTLSEAPKTADASKAVPATEEKTDKKDKAEKSKSTARVVSNDGPVHGSVNKTVAKRTGVRGNK